MDWMAGARMHVLEILALRGTTVIPMFVLGFSATAMNSYIFTVYLYSTLVHANLGWRFPVIEHLFVTPRFHHWHHAVTPPDRNFAVHFPWIDRLFGTFHLPRGEWPARMGLPGDPVPEGFAVQLAYPLRRRPGRIG